jgi:hypothetical protein
MARRNKNIKYTDYDDYGDYDEEEPYYAEEDVALKKALEESKK